jgi:hypothetical protein
MDGVRPRNDQGLTAIWTDVSKTDSSDVIMYTDPSPVLFVHCVQQGKYRRWTKRYVISRQGFNWILLYLPRCVARLCDSTS